MKDIVILGDMHLNAGTNIGRKSTGFGLNSRVLDQLTILDWLLNICNDRNINHIIITGDIFEDPRPTTNIVTLFMDWLKDCSVNNITVHIITGNHETLRSGSFYISPLDIIQLAEIDNVYVYNTISSININNLSITFVPFRDRRSFDTDVNSKAIELLTNRINYELSGLPLHNSKIVVGHLALEGSIYIGNEITDMTNELFCPLNMFNGYDGVFMGHIHKPQVLRKNPFIMHTGSMDISNFSEMDQKKLIIFLSSNSFENPEFIDIPTRPLKQLSINIPEEVIETTNFVIDAISSIDFKKSIVNLNIIINSVEQKPINRSIIENKLNDLGAFNIYKISEEKKLTIKRNKPVENIDNSITENNAINLWASTNLNDKEKDLFIKVANSIVEEYNSKNKD